MRNTSFLGNNFDQYNLLPLPPPWFEAVNKNLNKIYVNDVTGEEITEHPFFRSLLKTTTAPSSSSSFYNNNKNDNSNDSNNIESKNESKEASKEERNINLDDNEDSKIHSPVLSIVDEAQGGESTVASSTIIMTANPSTLQTMKNENFLKQNNKKPHDFTFIENGTIPNIHNSDLKKKIKFVDFRCEWKESSGGTGGTQSYGLKIRYFDDQKTLIKIDGVSGEWIATTLEGPYGPVNEYDLFVGAKIRVFGRHLTITSANASVCHDIEVKAQKLKKRISFMQNRIENVGAVPILQREAPVQMRHVTRGAKAEGHANLRKLYIDVSKLTEQMYDLGLSDVVKAMTMNQSNINKSNRSKSLPQLPSIASAQM